MFRNWCNKQNEKAAQDEVDKYVLDENRLLVQLACPSFAISGSLMGRNLKKLSIYSKQVLCIPAKSASSERNFSAAGYVTQARQTSLKKEFMANLLFLYKST